MSLLPSHHSVYLFWIVFGILCWTNADLRGQSVSIIKPVSEQNYFSGLMNTYQISRLKNKFMGETKTDHSIMLPSTVPEHADPLFCRIENKINEGNKIKCLFRLGSATYVNYLEQKGDRQRLMLEQLR